MQRAFLAFALAILVAPAAAPAQQEKTAVMYKAAGCGCCDGHAEHLRANGYKVRVIELADLEPIKKKHSVPEAQAGCHTIEVGGYVVEGHVPAKIINKLLAEKPKIKGISLPGMPEGSPGMSGAKTEPFKVYELGSQKVFAVD
ncbi:MAG TPA: DUF411 domain-containing protein [Alphaproteobacteria bacterium]|jgi:hypothetical protein